MGCIINNSIFCGIILFIAYAGLCTAFAGPPAERITCYVCENCANNEESLQETKQCRPGQACSAAFVRRSPNGELVSVRKRCVNRCTSPGDIYSISARAYRYCCTGDFCNAGLGPALPAEPSTTSSPIGTARQLKGFKGDPGYDGVPGFPGRNGLDGLPGGKGEPGYPGPKGKTGEAGDCWDCPAESGFAYCLPGPRGDRGQKGEPGYRGPRGSDGFPGLDGIKGGPGYPGQKGDPGYPGNPGRLGNHGLNGIPGQKGRKGKCKCPTSIPPSSPVVYHGAADNVRQTSHQPEPIVFHEVFVNEKGDGSILADASNSTFFLIPRSGIYVFHITSVTNGNRATPVVLLANNSKVMEVGQPTGSGTPSAQINQQVMLHLEAGDEVNLLIPGIIEEEDGEDDDGMEIYNKFSSPSTITFSVHGLQ